MKTKKHDSENAQNTVTAVPVAAAEPKALDPKKQASKLRASAKATRAAAEGQEDVLRQTLLTRAVQLETQANELDPKAERVAKAKAEPKPQCSKVLANGKQCQQRCTGDLDVCTDHRPAVQHLTEAERSWLEEQLGDVHKTPNSYAARVAFVAELAGWGQVRKAAKAAGVEQPKAE